ncbi:uncharacterized protein LOC129216332 [Uloborus diversus]|uniref:uncharacterized protein LOC129216332 n=1 Tax=Uloborus diversus TaxID=327109 RepID=UPI00240A880F|nr:uncharacterized protein LOC129216332 [Uloborus diversus]
MNPRLTSFDLSKSMVAAGIDIGTSTVRDRFLERGRKARRPYKKQLLTPRMKKKRLEWARKYKIWTEEDRHCLFKDIMHYVEVGREGPFNLKSFSEALNDFEPSITATEVMEVLDSMEKNEFEELDFGKFLFLLAYKDHAPTEEDPDDIDKKLSSKVVTARQCRLLSAISYFVLIASPEEIERFYFQNTRRKSTVLHHHLETTRLQGLTERQMEEKQLRARKNLAPLYKLTASPYASPVPFVPRFKKTKLYKELTDGQQSDVESNISKTKKKISRPIKPIKPKRELGEPWSFESEEDEICSQMHYGRIPLPEMKMPAKMLKDMRKRCTVEHKDFIMNKSYEALADFKQRMKEAAVIYARKSLKPILKKDFRSKDEIDSFVQIYQKYLPLELSDVKDFSLWIQPGGYQKMNTKKSSFPNQFAFGSKIP